MTCKVCNGYTKKANNVCQNCKEEQPYEASKPKQEPFYRKRYND